MNIRYHNLVKILVNTQRRSIRIHFHANDYLLNCEIPLILDLLSLEEYV